MADAALIDMVGSVAGALTTFAFLPQVIKTWRTGSTQDISLAMFVVFTSGVATWLAYGVMLMAWPIIIANLVTLLLSGTILAFKLREVFGRR